MKGNRSFITIKVEVNTYPYDPETGIRDAEINWIEADIDGNEGIERTMPAALWDALTDWCIDKAREYE